MSAVFTAFYFLPVRTSRFDGAVREALELTQCYAREHVIPCPLPTFWIAGAIGGFVSKQAVMRYFDPDAPKATSYRVNVGVECVGPVIIEHGVLKAGFFAGPNCGRGAGTVKQPEKRAATEEVATKRAGDERRGGGRA